MIQATDRKRVWNLPARLDSRLTSRRRSRVGQVAPAKSGGKFRILNLFRISNLEFRISKQGFTLLEMVVALGIFAVTITLAVGVVLAIFNARIKAATLQNVQDNLRYTFELMSRELRIGSQYSGTSCGINGCSQINFRWVDPLTVATEIRGYCLDAISGRGVIRRLYGGVVTCSQGAIMTADNVSVDLLLFLVDGAAPNADPVERAKDGQPRVTILMQVTSQGPRPSLTSTMNLETTVVQRIMGF